MRAKGAPGARPGIFFSPLCPPRAEMASASVVLPARYQSKVWACARGRARRKKQQFPGGRLDCVLAFSQPHPNTAVYLHLHGVGWQTIVCVRMVCTAAAFQLSVASRRCLNALERSHSGSVLFLCAHDGWWRFWRDISMLRGAVCGVHSCFDRVISHSVEGISARWRFFGFLGVLGGPRGREVYGS